MKLLITILIAIICNNGLNVSAENQPQKSSAEIKVVENKTSLTDELPKFKKNENYNLIRKKLIKAGWKPARSEEDGKENCVVGGGFCEKYPELESGPAAGMGNAIFRWKKGAKVLLIYTVDDPPLYVSSEFEKLSK